MEIQSSYKCEELVENDISADMFLKTELIEDEVSNHDNNIPGDVPKNNVIFDETSRNKKELEEQDFTYDTPEVADMFVRAELSEVTEENVPNQQAFSKDCVLSNEDIQCEDENIRSTETIKKMEDGVLDDECVEFQSITENCEQTISTEENSTIMESSSNVSNIEGEEPMEFSSPDNNQEIVCPHCNLQARTILELKKHMLTHLEDASNICDTCQYKSTGREDLRKHMKLQHGEKPSYSCPVCKYETNQKTILNIHLRKHTGEKPHRCSICNYSAAQRSNLTKHMRRHTGEKPHKCTVCDYSATEKSDLNNHMRVHTGEKPNKCKLCDYSTIQKSALISHMRRHTGEKPHKCEICDYRTVQKSTLICHMRIHTGEKPHSCTLCDYKTTGKSALNIHMRIHTGEKPHSCKICDYRTNQISNLNRHMRMHVTENRPNMHFIFHQIE